MQPVVMVFLLCTLGLVFLAVEVFLLPGFGIAGVLGVLFFIGGSVAAWAMLGSTWGILTVIGTTAATAVLLAAAFRTRTFRKRLVLDAHLEPGGGTGAEDLADLVGQVGEARSDLRPAGIADIDNRRVDVVSEGGFIEKGTHIKVVEVDGPRLVVARID